MRIQMQLFFLDFRFLYKCFIKSTLNKAYNLVYIFGNQESGLCKVFAVLQLCNGSRRFKKVQEGSKVFKKVKKVQEGSKRFTNFLCRHRRIRRLKLGIQHQHKHSLLLLCSAATKFPTFLNVQQSCQQIETTENFTSTQPDYCMEGWTT